MKKRYFILTLTLLAFLLNSCVSIHNPFKRRSSIEIKEGYLSLKAINNNLLQQMPISEKIGKNEVKIVSTTVFASKDTKSLIVEVEFIFTSFEIPEGLPAIARTKAALDYNPKTKEFKFARVQPLEIKYLKESLLEYITPQQQKFIPETIMLKLYELILHKSKRELGSMKTFSVKEGKIKIVFR